MSMMQRRKGKRGEQEAAAAIHAATGWEVRRRVRQDGGDSDLVGIPGWSAEVKLHAKATRADIRGWWDQAVAQAGEEIPVLFYRKARDEWRAVWPLSVSLISQRAEYWRDYEWTVEGAISSWAAVAREIADSGPRMQWIKIGRYTLSTYADGDYWLCNASGEGMQTSVGKLEPLVGEFFNMEF